MDAIRLLWFFFWRTCLLGTVIFGVLGAFCGALPMAVVIGIGLLEQDTFAGLGGAVFWMIGGGAIFGALGVLFGFVLGTLNGLLLWLLSRIWREPAADPSRFRNASGLLSAAATSTILLTDWALHGFDPNGFLLWRTFASPMDRSMSALAFAVFTTFIIASIMWWIGRRVSPGPHWHQG